LSALIATSSLPRPVIRTNGTVFPVFLSVFRNSMPSIPGMRKSETTTSYLTFVMAFMAISAEVALSIWIFPSLSRKILIVSRTPDSSSTRSTLTIVAPRSADSGMSAVPLGITLFCRL